MDCRLLIVGVYLTIETASFAIHNIEENKQLKCLNNICYILYMFNHYCNLCLYKCCTLVLHTFHVSIFLVVHLKIIGTIFIVKLRNI